MSDQPENLKDAIRQLRAALGGLTQERFARRLGITGRTAARWEASERLSPQILGQLRTLAAGARQWGLADWFEEQIREDLSLDLDDDEIFTVVPGPGTPEERDLWAEFVTGYRAEDPEIQLMAERLRERKARRDLENEKQVKKRAAKPRPTLKEIILNKKDKK
jgi:transcriptional regulator with XRE-family HTH domain